MNDLKTSIINLIKKNRISTVEVADALGKSGVIDGPKPVNKGQFVVGEVQYIYGHSETNWPIHEQGETVKEGGILFVDTLNFKNKAAFGDIVTKYFILYKGLDGVVVNGNLRAANDLVKENYPVWCINFTPLGCFNKNIEPTNEILNLAQEHKQYYDGGILVCDDSGCTFVEKERISEETHQRLEFIELQEDIWYYCVDTLKWSTYKTICEKAYLTEGRELLPQKMQEKLKEFNL